MLAGSVVVLLCINQFIKSYMKILKVDCYRLTNGETITYSVDTRNVIDTYPAQKAALIKVYTPFQYAIEQTIQSSKKVDNSSYSTTRTELNTLRSHDFLHFRGIAESGLKSSDLLERQQARLVANTIKLHGWKMQALPPDKFSAQLNSLLSSLEAENLVAAITGIGAGKALANLKGGHARFLEADRQRMEVWADLSDTSTTKALKAVIEAIINLFTAIEGLLLTSDDPLLIEMVEKLNVITEAKQQTLKAKTTRAENAKKEALENGTNMLTAKKAEKKPAKKRSQKQTTLLQPEGEALHNELVEQQLLVDHSGDEHAATMPQGIEQKASEENDTTV